MESPQYTTEDFDDGCPFATKHQIDETRATFARLERALTFKKTELFHGGGTVVSG